jgi:hypothetical protein
MNAILRAGAGILVFSFFGAASAHHAGVAYDHGNMVTVSGTVKEFRWSNPHTWISVMVPGGKGGEERWDVEGTTINALIRAGWTSKTLQPGMKVKILVSPRKDSAPGGEWNKIISINEVPFLAPVERK